MNVCHKNLLNVATNQRNSIFLYEEEEWDFFFLSQLPSSL